MNALMQSKRAWLVGGVLVAVLIAVASWLLVIHPQLSSASSLREQAASAQQQNDITQAKVDRLRTQSENLGDLVAKLTSAVNSLPPVSGLPEFTREATAAAHATGVRLSSVAVGSITAVKAKGGSTGSTAAATGSQPSGSAAGGLYAIPVTLQSTGPLSKQAAFLKAVQTGARRALVVSTRLASASTARGASVDAGATMTTQVMIYTAPMNPQQLARLQKLLRGDISG